MVLLFIDISYTDLAVSSANLGTLTILTWLLVKHYKHRVGSVMDIKIVAFHQPAKLAVANNLPSSFH